MRTAESEPTARIHISDSHGLSEGWCWANLGNIAELISGTGFPKRCQGNVGMPYPFFKVGNLGDVETGEVLKQAPDTIDDFILQELRAKLIPPDSVLFAKIGMAIGLNRRRLTGIQCCIDNNMMAAIPSCAILPRYLLRFLETVEFMQYTQATTVPSLRKSELTVLGVPLPPLAEQKLIVAKVEELLARVNAARERLAKVKEILKRFRQSVLAAACSGRLTEDWRKTHTNITPAEVSIQEILSLREKQWAKENGPEKKYRCPKSPKTDDLPEIPESWKYLSSDALFLFVTSGSRGWAKYYSEAGPTFLRVGNLDHDSVNLDLSHTQHVAPPGGAERDRTRVRGGDILISITADVGMIGLVPDAVEEAYVNQHVAISRPVEGVYRPFLAWYLASREGGQAQFQSLQRGATKVGLGLDDIRSVSVPFPPVEEQKEIVRRIETLFELTVSIEKRVSLSIKRAEKLVQAVLAKAFRGELVPTEAELARHEGRSYEPASALLAKIKAQRKDVKH